MLWWRHVRAGAVKFPKSWRGTLPLRQKIHHFFLFPYMGHSLQIFAWGMPLHAQGLRASSLQFTSPLEFNAIFRDGFPLRVDLNGWSKIRDPVTAKFKHARLL